MDVHDLARALCRAMCDDDPWPSIGLQWQAIGEAYEAVPHMLPYLEAHTRAAVEAERAKWRRGINTDATTTTARKGGAE